MPLAHLFSGFPVGEMPLNSKIVVPFAPVEPPKSKYEPLGDLHSSSFRFG